MMRWEGEGRIGRLERLLEQETPAVDEAIAALQDVERLTLEAEVATLIRRPRVTRLP
jgi:hypothetical protein